jgi:2-polyprenyl-3-methyl-5-hydroxy-6-metoxy-1,4-benzoquinol methylase
MRQCYPLPMKRLLEPDIMKGESAIAYSAGNFDEAHGRFVKLFCESVQSGREPANLLDIGCGHADILIRLAGALDRFILHGIDGSETMIQIAKDRIRTLGMANRIQIWQERIPGPCPGLLPTYDALVSNSLLHHLTDPVEFWAFLKERSHPGTFVFVMDLHRPGSQELTRDLVASHAGGDSPVLRKDFFNSLLASYEASEISAQLAEAGLRELNVQTPDPLHWLVSGTIR